MANGKRPDFANQVVHVVNRGVQRRQLYATVDDYAAFEVLLIETLKKCPIRLVAFCVMPNHWHLVLWPRSKEELSRFMHLLTMTHAKRINVFRGVAGNGHVYQGPYRASLVEPEEGHFFCVVRYVERNALRANLVESTLDWRWGSAWHRQHGDPRGLLCEPPFELPVDWSSRLDVPHTAAELEALRRASRRGAPIGSPDWVDATVKRFGLESTVRPRGRPPKQPARRPNEGGFEKTAGVFSGGRSRLDGKDSGCLF